MKYDEHGMPMVRDPETGELVSLLAVRKSAPKPLSDILAEAREIIRAGDEADKKGHSKTMKFKANDVLSGAMGAGRSQMSRVPGLADALAIDRKLRKNGM